MSEVGIKVDMSENRDQKKRKKRALGFWWDHTKRMEPEIWQWRDTKLAPGPPKPIRHPVFELP